MSRTPGTVRLLIVVGLGTAAFSMQDILLEPYGGEILNLSVGATTMLTAMLATGSLCGFALAARLLSRGHDPYRLAANGVLIGVFAFSAVIFASPLESIALFRIGATLIGFGGGLFAVGTLIAAMSIADKHPSGLVIGAWGSVQATAAGLAIAFGGAHSRQRLVARNTRRARPRAQFAVHRLQRGLSHRNRAAVRHAGRNRSADQAVEHLTLPLSNEVRSGRTSNLT